MVATAGARPASAQSAAPQLGDPSRCVVILEDMGPVGFRISDAQVVADAILTHLRKRVGFEATHYEGVAAAAAAMKKLLATPEGAGPQEAQLAWFKACERSAPWRVRARFGTDKGGDKRHWISASCRRSGLSADPKKGELTEDTRVRGATFLAARDALVAALPAFCPALTAAVQLPVEGASSPGAPHGGTPANGVANGAPDAPPGNGPPGMSKKKAPRPWVPPPRRD